MLILLDDAVLVVGVLLAGAEVVGVHAPVALDRARSGDNLEGWDRRWRGRGEGGGDGEGGDGEGGGGEGGARARAAAARAAAERVRAAAGTSWPFPDNACVS